jgi:hypothetical protein
MIGSQVMNNKDNAQQMAGACWSDDRNCNTVMDVNLATSFAERYEKALDLIETLRKEVTELKSKKKSSRNSGLRSLDSDWIPSQR